LIGIGERSKAVRRSRRRTVPIDAGRLGRQAEVEVMGVGRAVGVAPAKHAHQLGLAVYQVGWIACRLEFDFRRSWRDDSEVRGRRRERDAGTRIDLGLDVLGRG